MKKLLLILIILVSTLIVQSQEMLVGKYVVERFKERGLSDADRLKLHNVQMYDTLVFLKDRSVWIYYEEGQILVGRWYIFRNAPQIIEEGNIIPFSFRCSYGGTFIEFEAIVFKKAYVKNNFYSTPGY